MRLNHNKKRNTAIIFELLVNELSRATLYKKQGEKRFLVGVIKEFFHNEHILRKELEIYNSFDEFVFEDESMATKILSEAKKQYLQLDKDKIYEEQTKVINKVNKNLGKKVWANYVSNYKKLASINQALQQVAPPKKQVMLEQRLLSLLSTTSQPTATFPKVNNLAIKTFIKNFNSEYSEKLNERQKDFLNKYIFSYMDNGLEFKAYLYEEIESLKGQLSESRQKCDSGTSRKVEKILNRMSSYNKRKIDKDFILELMQIQSLASELNK